MPPPPRNALGDYHFHTYDFAHSAAWQLGPAQPARGNLRFYSMVRDLEGLAAYAPTNNVPNVALTSISPAINGDGVDRHIRMLSFGGPPDPSSTPQVVITGGIHAREWIAPEMAYLLAEYLIKNYPPDGAGGLTRYQKNIRDLVRSRRIHIIPLLNPNGNDYAVFSNDHDARRWRKNRRQMQWDGNRWWRALTNARPPPDTETHRPFQTAVVQATRECTYDVPIYDPEAKIPPGTARFATKTMVQGVGVDLNRNFHTPAWGYNGKTDLLDLSTANLDDYFGPRAGSEAETASIETFLAGCPNVKAAIDYHSYGEFIVYPTEAHFAGKVDAGYRNLAEALECMIVDRLGNKYQVGTPLDTMLYHATGTLSDHLALTKDSQAFVIELDPLLGGEAGFELPESRIQSVFEGNIRGALGLIAAAGRPATAWFRKTVGAAAREYQDWDVTGRGNSLPL
jgi:hypothetical protein